MGRPPSNGGPAFRFMPNEVVEMEAILQEHQNNMPNKEILVALAEKFSESPERKGKIVVQMKQVWNWFQNRRYAIRAKTTKTPVKLNVTPMSRDDSTTVKNVPQPVSVPIPTPTPSTIPAPSVPAAGRANGDNSYREFEAKSARDGAWYDVGTFLSHRHLDTGDPEVLVRFSGFGSDEDEWLKVHNQIRQRSLPCEASECVAVLPGDLILCFQEGKDQALYFDAHVLDAQRRRHDVRGCRCRFLVRYDHDQSEEIVPLRKICRRPETDYRLQQLHAANETASTNQPKASSIDPSTASIQRLAISSPEVMQKQGNGGTPMTAPVSHASVPSALKPVISELKSVESGNAVNPGNVTAPPSAVTTTALSGSAPTSNLSASTDNVQGGKVG